MVPLVAGIIWLGVYPAPVLRRMEPARRALRHARSRRGAAPTRAHAPEREDGR